MAKKNEEYAQKERDIFASNFKRILRTCGKTQAQVADYLNVRTSTVSDWAKARKYPRVDKMQMIADYLGVTISDLREQEDSSPSGQTKEQVVACELFQQRYGKEAFSAVSKFLQLDKVDRARVVERIDTLLEADKYTAPSKLKRA